MSEYALSTPVSKRHTGIGLTERRLATCFEPRRPSRLISYIMAKVEDSIQQGRCATVRRRILAPHSSNLCQIPPPRHSGERGVIIDGVMSDVTQILSQIAQGDPSAAEQLLPLVYDELRHLASQKLARESPGQTLQATALVHEAYIRLVGADDSYQWDNQGHFFAAAAEAMRRILIDQARRKQSEKHGGGRQRFELGEQDLISNASPDRLLALDEALCKLSREEPESAELVKLRAFAGLSVEQAANVLGISRANAYRHWAYARAWLRAETME